MKSVSKLLTLLLYFSRPCGSNQCYNYTMVYCFDYCGKLHEEDSNECRQNEILGGANISEPIRKIGSKFLNFFSQKLKVSVIWFQLIIDLYLESRICDQGQIGAIFEILVIKLDFSVSFCEFPLLGKKFHYWSNKQADR